MGAWIDKRRCTACGACVRICPGDLLHPDTKGKAENLYPMECWHCMACVKACAHDAVHVNLAFSIANRGARLKCKVSDEAIHWTCIDPQGQTLEFDLPKTTTTS